MEKVQYTGLTKEEVQERIVSGKVNEINHHRTRTVQEILLNNIFTYFNFINLILFLLVCITGSFKNGAFFLTIIFNDIICIVQEIHAKKVMDQMSLLVLASIPVYRNGQKEVIKVDELVLDDICEISSGMQVPSDAEILSGYVEVNESILTGEANTLHKGIGEELLAGSIVIAGNAIVQVVHVGKDNFSETIMSDAKKYKPAKSMLNTEINRLLRLISVVIIPFGIFLFINPYLQMGDNETHINHVF